jgi:hypothetical protein
MEKTMPTILRNQCIIMKALQLLLQTGKYRGTVMDRCLEELSTAILESEPMPICGIDDLPDE